MQQHAAPGLILKEWGSHFAPELIDTLMETESDLREIAKKRNGD
ncbi:hypothetical protein [Shewanella litorisediminis]|nr:hypothetical protein [Shewanella litorisediminis]